MNILKSQFKHGKYVYSLSIGIALLLISCSNSFATSITQPKEVLSQSNRIVLPSDQPNRIKLLSAWERGELIVSFGTNIDLVKTADNKGDGSLGQQFLVRSHEINPEGKSCFQKSSATINKNNTLILHSFR